MESATADPTVLTTDAPISSEEPTGCTDIFRKVRAALGGINNIGAESFDSCVNMGPNGTPDFHTSTLASWIFGNFNSLRFG
jgi:hypothetical protein